MNAQRIAQLRTLAAKYIKEWADTFNPTDGWVITYRGKVSGWALALDEPHKNCPGCLAIPVAGGPIMVAVGGDDNAGAECWQRAN